jgi:S1-C subfamily serine protease
MILKVAGFAAAILLVCAGVRAEEPSLAEQAAVADAVQASLVRVEVSLRYDKGEEPRAGPSPQAGCAAQSQPHDSFQYADIVNEERPLELAGFLVSPTRVVALDPMIHPRFVEGIAVRFKGDLVKARPAAYGKDQRAVFLELERPLKDAKPLKFDGNRKGPYLTVFYEQVDGVWTTGVDLVPEGGGLSVTETGRKYCPAPRGSLVVDRHGMPVALCMRDEMPPDDSWKGPPSAWAVMTADELAKLLDGIAGRVCTGAVRVTLYFRSPHKDLRGMRSRDEEKGATEQYATGVLLDANRVLVLANLKPGVTARLERILVRPEKGEAVAAKFTASLKDYGCLVATLEKPLPCTIALSAKNILDCKGLLLPAAEVRLHGEDWSVYYEHRRIEFFSVGWKRQVYPQLSQEGEGESLVLFDEEGALLALPVARREKVALEDRYSSREPLLTPVAYLKPVLDNLQKYVDINNVPLGEDQESRLAWLGAELQPLNEELARAGKVSDLTHDGQTGAIISCVYPGSPAEKAGVEAGWILLRLRVEGQPKPLEVRLDREDRMDGPFPWEELDEVQEQYYDRIPTPWPGVENPLTRALTDLGFGTKFKAEFFADGKSVEKDLEVVPSPAHYDSAPRLKSAPLGLTVRDMTYEVRRYFQKKDDEPGVVVSKVEPGGKVSVAGIKPFEIITHVNDKPVMNVKDFEAATAGQEELRLSVKRMTRGRVVKIKMIGAAAAAKPPAAEEPASAEKPVAGEKPAAGTDEPSAGEPPPKKKRKPRAEDKPVP